MYKKFLFLMLVSTSFFSASAQRQVTDLKYWEFSRDSLNWTRVRIPHDWAIAGPFDKKWDLQKVAITQNGETEATEKSGRSGALPWIGKGYYKTTFRVEKGKQAELVFDGAMSEPVVYVNGRKVGEWKYGYNAFRIDVTPYIHQGKENLLQVSLNNREESSRWYPGAGLYRPVKLISTGDVKIEDWGTFITTENVNSQGCAKLHAKVKLEGCMDKRSVRLTLLDAEGKTKAVANKKANTNVDFDIFVDRAQLWSPENPYLYQLKIEVLASNKKTAGKETVLDDESLKYGIRTISFDKTNGFMLNGKTRKFQGVCLHHDLGPLGAAVNKAALIRQVKLMKDMGADAIRTSHNMPSQMQMEVYDSLGVMVMGESFDMWFYAKCKNGYSKFFKEWADRDIENLVKANRNHPSLVMYSIGNEIPDQWSKEGRDEAEYLQNICHLLDPTRPVTQGMDRAEDALKSGFAQVMDIPGFNYRVYKYGRNIKQLPVGFLLGSETASTVSSRGIYKFPVEWNNDKTWEDGQLSGYDTEWCSWSNLPEEDFMAMEDAPYTICQFIWTGIDYLGEPSPYDEYWPSRSSYFGACDLAGLPKDRYYLYRSVWNKKEHTIHVLPHWTWPGREGKVTPVFCYTDYPCAELFVNGISQGRIHKAKIDDAEWKTGHPATSQEAEERAARYRLMWKNVKYTPGEIKVVTYDEAGHQTGETTVKTAGEAKALKLQSDRESLKADGEDLAYIKVSLVDAEGTEIPNATDALSFEVSGEGTFEAVCNGDATSLESFKQPKMHLFAGKLVLTVRAGEHPGKVHVKVKDMDHHIEKEILIPVIHVN
jgi:beta-galactosidase